MKKMKTQLYEYFYEPHYTHGTHMALEEKLECVLQLNHQTLQDELAKNESSLYSPLEILEYCDEHGAYDEDKGKGDDHIDIPVLEDSLYDPPPLQEDEQYEGELCDVKQSYTNAMPIIHPIPTLTLKQVPRSCRYPNLWSIIHEHITNWESQIAELMYAEQTDKRSESVQQIIEKRNVAQHHLAELVNIYENIDNINNDIKYFSTTITKIQQKLEENRQHMTPFRVQWQSIKYGRFIDIDLQLVDEINDMVETQTKTYWSMVHNLRHEMMLAKRYLNVPHAMITLCVHCLVIVQRPMDHVDPKKRFTCSSVCAIPITQIYRDDDN